LLDAEFGVGVGVRVYVSCLNIISGF